MSDIEMGTVYDMNKQLVQSQEKQISKYKLGEKKKEIISFLRDNKSQYYMLLNNERRDYTIFNFDIEKSEECLAKMVNVLVDECLTNRGEIRGLDLTEAKDAFEIWLSIEEESFCYYLFPYDIGVIEASKEV